MDLVDLKPGETAILPDGSAVTRRFTGGFRIRGLGHEPSAAADLTAKKDDEGAIGDVRARHLIEWFNEGADGQIPWGAPGDLTACHRVAAEHMTTEQAWGYCQERHHDALGTYNTN